MKQILQILSKALADIADCLPDNRPTVNFISTDEPEDKCNIESDTNVTVTRFDTPSKERKPRRTKAEMVAAVAAEIVAGPPEETPEETEAPTVVNEDQDFAALRDRITDTIRRLLSADTGNKTIIRATLDKMGITGKVSEVPDNRLLEFLTMLEKL